MQHNINSLTGFKIAATDGEVGEVKEFYFEDQDWNIRYIILKTGNWLSGRKVLISPVALKKSFWESGLFHVNLTKEQILKSPDIDTEKPVSRQNEIELYEHYGWDNYWGSGFYGGGGMYAGDFYPVTDEEIKIEAAKTDKLPNGDPHLRSSERVIGYHVHAADGDLGHVCDFIMDDLDWKIKSVVINTHNWLGGKKVCVDAKHITAIEWDVSKVFLNVTIASIENSPVFNDEDYFTPDQEDNVVVTIPVIPVDIH